MLLSIAGLLRLLRCGLAVLLLALTPPGTVKLETAEAWAEELPQWPGDEHDDTVAHVEEVLDPNVGDLSDQCAERNSQATKEHSPAPSLARKRNGIKGFAALEDDDELAGDGDALNTNEPRVSEHSLVPNANVVVDTPAIMLIECLRGISDFA
jgi:hypothetical protein